MENEDNKINVVSGDGTDLDISKVYNHLNVEESKSETPEKNNVIIPTEKKTDSNS